MGNWITFRGISSADFETVVIQQIQPVPRAARRYTSVVVPGRSGELTIDDRTYAPVEQVVLVGVRGVSEIMEINAWLNGEGDLVTSKDPTHRRRAHIYNGLNHVRLGGALYEFEAVFIGDPFRYLAAPGDDIELTTSPAAVINPGTWEAEPIITVTGSGDVTLNVGNQVITLYDIAPGIVIDSATLNAYRDTVNMNGHMAGLFPILPVGSTSISWVGTVESVTIRPNWRWL